MLDQTPQGKAHTATVGQAQDVSASTPRAISGRERRATDGLILILDCLVLLDLKQVLLPRRKRLKHEDLARRVVGVSVGERGLDDGSRGEPGLGQVRQLGQELGSSQRRRNLELGLRMTNRVVR